MRLRLLDQVKARIATIPSKRETLLDEALEFVRFDQVDFRLLTKTSLQPLKSSVTREIELENPANSFIIWGRAGVHPPKPQSIIILVTAFDGMGEEVPLNLSSNTQGDYCFYPMKNSDAEGFFKRRVVPETAVDKVVIKISPWTKEENARSLCPVVGITPSASHPDIRDNPVHRSPKPTAVSSKTSISTKPIIQSREHADEHGLDIFAQRASVTSSIELLSTAIDLTRTAAVREAAKIEALQKAVSWGKELALATGDVALGKKILQGHLRVGNLTEAGSICDGLDIKLEKVDRFRHLGSALQRPLVRGTTPSVGASGCIPYLLHNCHPFHTGGYAVRAQGLISGWEAAGERVVPIARLGYPHDRTKTVASVSQSYERNGITYNYLGETDQYVDQPDQEAYATAYASQVIDFLSAKQVKLVVAASFFNNAMAARKVADVLRVPMAYDMRGMAWITNRSTNPALAGSEIDNILMQTEIRAAKSADIVFCITEQLRSWLVSMGVERSRTCLLPNGVDPVSFSGAETHEVSKQRFGYEADQFVLGYVGTVVHYEGLDTLIQALGRIPARTASKIRVMIVGDGAYLEEAKRFVGATGLESVVRFVGRVPHQDVQEYYSVMDAIVIPRKANELSDMISPIKPFESLAMGKVTIASDCGAIKDIYEQANCGRLFEAGNASALAEAILDVHDNLDRFRNEAIQGRDWVMKERSWAAIGKNATSFWNSFETRSK